VELGKARSLAKNSFWLTAGTGATILVGAIYRPIIAVVLGPIDYGRYSFITTFIGYFTILAYFGVRWVVVREVGRNPAVARAYLQVGLKIRIVTALIAIVACCTIGFFLRPDPSVRLGIIVLSSSLAIGGMGEILEGVLLAFGRSYFIAIANLAGNLLKLAIGIWALRAGYGLIGVLIVFVVTAIVSAGLDWFFLRPLLRAETSSNEKPVSTKSVLRESLPFVVYAVAARLYQKNDVLFMAMLRGYRATGIYSAAYAFLDLFLAASNSVVSSVYPLVSKMHAESTDALGIAYERLHKYMLLALIPTSILLMLLGPLILVTVFRKAYAGGGLTLQILVWTLPVEMSSSISGAFLCAMYRQKLTAVITIYMATLSVMATIGLIVLYGALGAAIATVGGSAVSAVIHYVYVKKVVGSVSTLNAWLKPAVCGGLMLFAISYVPISMTIARIMAGILVYSAAFAVIKPLDAEDKRLILSIVKRKVA
jgi:O-antigen/teichoic acid export membrane protein